MEIERAWGHEDGWFNSIPRERQVKMLAWYRVHTDPEGKRLKAKRARGKDFWGL
jgi:hypothetical protein